jgi:hypothetical protein
LQVKVNEGLKGFQRKIFRTNIKTRNLGDGFIVLLKLDFIIGYLMEKI